ncbi:AraC family transcriptional regulator [Asaia prunellae]|uniref:AraC family transcriptional regulator n=1 Tax=Asaia prunellae TaxID=610245 RepID=UPI000471A0D6|nr:cupin domain-containing protein [Asaia prunellae]
MDLLDRVLSSLRTQGEVWGRITLTGRYGLAFPEQHAVFIAVMEGRCWINQDDDQDSARSDGQLTALNEGDFLFFPAPSRFHLRSDTEITFTTPLTARQLAQWEEERAIEYCENTGERVSLVVGCFTLLTAEAPLLFRELPPILHVPSHQADSLSCQVRAMMRDEIARDEAGATSTVDRLAEILMIRTLRRAASDHVRLGLGWLRAMADPRIHKALRIMHADLSVVHTVAQIARAVGMSRSAFADHFRKQVGATPLEHLMTWRMAFAADLLRTDRKMKIEAVASQIGYLSERAFREAFSKTYGCSPDKYRKAGR